MFHFYAPSRKPKEDLRRDVKGLTSFNNVSFSLLAPLRWTLACRLWNSSLCWTGDSEPFPVPSFCVCGEPCLSVCLGRPAMEEHMWTAFDLLQQQWDQKRTHPGPDPKSGTAAAKYISYRDPRSPILNALILYHKIMFSRVWKM